MTKTILSIAIAAAIAAPIALQAQSKPTSATYITKEEVDKVNATPGVDRTIKVMDIGGEHFSVGIIHRVAPQPRGANAGGAAPGGAAARGGGRGAGRAVPPPDCGELTSTPPTSGGAPGTISHDSQTEGYLIVSGGGTMITGGHIVNGRKSGPDNEVTTTWNGPSCSGTAYGDDVVRKDVKVGDIIIIPAGVPHGWTGITTEVTYLSFRPSGQALTVGYVNPAIK
jgi:mannose-6-phosphate isomerase-like protein (cupin superfamily)